MDFLYPLEASHAAPTAAFLSSFWTFFQPATSTPPGELECVRFSVLAEYCDFPDLAALGGFEGVENVEVLCLLRNGERDFCRFRPHFRASRGFYEQGGLSAVGFGRERHVRDIRECRRVPVIEFGGVLIRSEVEPPAFPVAGGFVGVSDICGFPHIERGGLLFHFHIPEMELSERMFKAEVEARVRRVVRDADQNFYFCQSKSPVGICGPPYTLPEGALTESMNFAPL